MGHNKDNSIPAYIHSNDVSHREEGCDSSPYLGQESRLLDLFLLYETVSIGPALWEQYTYMPRAFQAEYPPKGTFAYHTI